MLENEVPNDLACEVWKRDEFTCRFCGDTTPWEEVHILYEIPPEKGGKMEESNMITVCSHCVWEGKTGPIPEKEKKRILSLIRELVSYTNINDEVIFEDDYEREVLDLNKKVESLKEDIKKLSGALQERDRMAIAFKKKMDRAYQDMENLKRRMDTEINMRVKENMRSALMSMIVSYDNIERAIDDAKKNMNIKEVANVVSGLEFIRKGMLDRMKMKDVIMINPEGEIFDPRFHETIGSRENKELNSNTIIEVIEVGFLHDDQVLRPAKVMISTGGKKVRRKIEKIQEFELDEEEETDSILEMDPWKSENEDYIVAKPRKKKQG